MVFHLDVDGRWARKGGAILLAVVAIMLTAACGGSSSGGGILSGANATTAPATSGTTAPGSTVRPSTPTSGTDDKAAQAAAQKLFVDLFGMLGGTRTPANVLGNFTEACVSQTPLAALLSAVDRFQADNPGVKGLKVEDIDFGSNVKVERSGSDVTVRIPGTRDAQVKVDGKFVNAHQYFVQRGLEKDSEGSSTSSVKLTTVDGRFRVSDCGLVKSMADYKGSSSSTPSRATPTATPRPR